MGETAKKKKFKKVGMLILGGAITVFILMMFLSMNNITEIFGVVRTADLGYVAIAAGVLAVYVILSPLTICMLARSKGTKVSFANSYVIGMTEHFFSGITPFSTGGQPFQVYEYNKVKVKPAESTGILLMNFIIHMLVTNAFALISLVYYAKFTAGDNMNVIAIIGFTMNFLVLLFMIALATSVKIRNLLSKIVLLLCKIKWLKKFLEPQVPKLNAYFEQVQSAFQELWKKKGTFFGCILVKIVMMAAYYAMTFYILRALHIEVGYDQMFFIICGTSFAITMVVFLPTPGSSGGIEYAFKNIFVSIAGVSSTVAYGGMLIWRLLSYYLLMIVSLMFYIGFEIKVARMRKREALVLADLPEAIPAEPQTVVSAEENPEPQPESEPPAEEIPDEPDLTQNSQSEEEL